MQLTATPPAGPDLDRTVAAALDERLRRDSRRPLAVGLSGGGDSLALLLAAAAWAKAAGRPLLVLTVDHGLQPQSAAWTAACAEQAARLGAAFQALPWIGEKPARGLPAAARAARHRLLGEAARAAGARVILLGHTADDVAEARVMRQAGSSTPEPRAWSPSPAWPEGRGLFLLRPLLGVSRAAIRGWLAARGERWIEDPANQDPRFARTRARRALPAHGPAPAAEAAVRPQALAAACQGDAFGVLRIPRDLLRSAAPAEAAAFAGAACLSAAGAGRPPARARLQALVGRLRAEAPVTATLAGARIEADADEIRFMREPGEAARGGLQPSTAAAGETVVWDGRFEITADRPMVVRALAGLAGRLPRDERQALRAAPPAARAALPARRDGEAAACLALDAEHCRPLALTRLQAACGLVEREPA